MPKLIDVDILFEAVVRVFADRGYAATTTLEIAARAGSELQHSATRAPSRRGNS